jgi:hypothetical protein
MVSQAPELNELLVMLRQARGDLEAGTLGGTLSFSRAKLARARAELAAMIRRGEEADAARLVPRAAQAALPGPSAETPRHDGGDAALGTDAAALGGP